MARWAVQDRASTAYHHGSHLDLVQTITRPESAKVDAIIVPTGRPAAYLESAMYLAQHHRCTLVALCSVRSSPRAVRDLAKTIGVEIVAVDVNDSRHLIPEFETTRMLRGTRFNRHNDTSFKRNLGLLLARMAGWERVVYLDDDIWVSDPDDLAGAVGPLGRYASVGLRLRGFPDNSVVCHAYRMTGGPQESFIGGGALAVGVESFNSFFPNIYNEDWFFLLNDNGLRPSALTTGEVKQTPYDPFHDAVRARSEELGDCLAEGLFQLLDDKRPLSEAKNLDYWAGFLTKRRRFIDDVITAVHAAVPPKPNKAQMIESLNAAKGRNWVIEPQLCVEYVEAWRRDRTAWRERIHATPRWLGVEKALAALGLMHGYQAAS